jgi:hypothetical protein
MILEKTFPFGNTLQSDVKELPSALRIQMHQEIVSRQSYTIDIEIFFKDVPNGGLAMRHLPSKYPAMLFVGTEHDDRLVYFQCLPVREFDLNSTNDSASMTVFHGRFTCTNVPSGTLPFCLTASIIFENCIGRDVTDVYTIDRGAIMSPCSPNATNTANKLIPIDGSASSTPNFKSAALNVKRFNTGDVELQASRRKMTFEDYAHSEGSPVRKTPINTRTEDVCNRCGKRGHWAKDCELPDQRSEEEKMLPREGHKCRRCSQLGHYARDCPQNPEDKRCHACGEEGHFARDCPNGSQTPSASASDVGETTPGGDWSFIFD